MKNLVIQAHRDTSDVTFAESLSNARTHAHTMSVFHDEVEVEDMEWNEELQAFTYQCPCGDLFRITLVRWPPISRTREMTWLIGRTGIG